MMIQKCKMCGGVLNPAGTEKIITCEYCGTKQTLPCPDSERIARLYEKADTYRRNLEFDKALALYEEILNEDSTDAECYWLALLCEFGIEYVEESDGKRIPTINRMQAESVFDNANYKAALQYATEEQAEIYKAEAEEISNIQKGILEISEKEEPFDIFICYKESDDQGRRTLDSVLAMDLYEILTKEGYKVFFSRVTLDDKIGVAYEPYIYAALQSSKIMIAVGTKAEHYNAVWVRNEWSRYLALMKSGAKKVLIPAYKDMDPYELPEEFKHLQAVNLGELGYQQDLISGIRKILNVTFAGEERAQGRGPMEQMYVGMKAKVWRAVEESADKILKDKPGCMEARVCKKLAIMGIFEERDLERWGVPGSDTDLLERIQSGDTQYLEMLNVSANNTLPETIEADYVAAIKQFDKAQTEEDYVLCEKLFPGFKGYKDAFQYERQIKEKLSYFENRRRRDEYNKYFKLTDSNDPEELKKAIQYFESVPGYLDADQRAASCRARLPVVEQLVARKAQELKKKKTREFLMSEGGVILILMGILTVVGIIMSIVFVITDLIPLFF